MKMSHGFPAAFLGALFVYAVLRGATAACAATSPAAPDSERVLGRLQPAGRLELPQLTECSGIACLGGAYWAHNDSGDGPTLYRATTLEFGNAEVLEVPGASARDWEDIDTIDDDIVVFDVGDNRLKRTDCTIYRVRYLARTDERGADLPGELSLVAAYRFRYPDGPHDAEAGIVIDGKIHLVTKAAREPSTIVYRFDDLPVAGGSTRNVSYTPVKVGELELEPGEQVTAGTYDAPSGTLLLLTYSSILRYSKDRLSGPPLARTRIWARQCEAMAICGTTLLITNEERDVFSLPEFLASSYAVLAPNREGSSVPLHLGTFRLGQDASSWKAYSRDLPLRNAEPGEFAQWLLTGDRLLVRAGFRAAGAIVPTGNPATVGTCVVLMFAPIEAREEDAIALATHVVVGVDGNRRVRAWRLLLSEGGPVLSDLPGAEIVGHSESGLEFELSLPTHLLFERDMPSRFLFDLQATGFRKDDDPYYFNQGPFALERPLAWADVRVEG